jgi:hypothetical protein
MGEKNSLKVSSESGKAPSSFPKWKHRGITLLALAIIALGITALVHYGLNKDYTSGLFIAGAAITPFALVSGGFSVYRLLTAPKPPQAKAPKISLQPPKTNNNSEELVETPRIPPQNLQEGEGARPPPKDSPVTVNLPPVDTLPRAKPSERKPQSPTTPPQTLNVPSRLPSVASVTQLPPRQEPSTPFTRVLPPNSPLVNTPSTTHTAEKREVPELPRTTLQDLDVPSRLTPVPSGTQPPLRHVPTDQTPPLHVSPHKPAPTPPAIKSTSEKPAPSSQLPSNTPREDRSKVHVPTSPAPLKQPEISITPSPAPTAANEAVAPKKPDQVLHVKAKIDTLPWERQEKGLRDMCDLPRFRGLTEAERDALETELQLPCYEKNRSDFLLYILKGDGPNIRLRISTLDKEGTIHRFEFPYEDRYLISIDICKAVKAPTLLEHFIFTNTSTLLVPKQMEQAQKTSPQHPNTPTHTPSNSLSPTAASERPSAVKAPFWQREERGVERASFDTIPYFEGLSEQERNALEENLQLPWYAPSTHESKCDFLLYTLEGENSKECRWVSTKDSNGNIFRTKAEASPESKHFPPFERHATYSIAQKINTPRRCEDLIFGQYATIIVPKKEDELDPNEEEVKVPSWRRESTGPGKNELRDLPYFEGLTARERDALEASLELPNYSGKDAKLDFLVYTLRGDRSTELRVSTKQPLGSVKRFSFPQNTSLSSVGGKIRFYVEAPKHYDFLFTEVSTLIIPKESALTPAPSIATASSSVKVEAVQEPVKVPSWKREVRGDRKYLGDLPLFKGLTERERDALEVSLELPQYANDAKLDYLVYTLKGDKSSKLRVSTKNPQGVVQRFQSPHDEHLGYISPVFRNFVQAPLKYQYLFSSIATLIVPNPDDAQE